MREILFKAKRIDTGEWVEGYLHKCEGEFVISNNDGLGEFINAETLCQYTGLIDKNGQKIWENDILLQKTTDMHWCRWQCTGIVKYGKHDWNEGEYGYDSVGFYIEPIVKKGDIERMSCGVCQDYFIDENYPYEVIGNIFDNPELLEGGGA